MSPTQAQQIHQLYHGLLAVIDQADVSPDTEIDAVDVVEFYLGNPLRAVEPSFLGPNHRALNHTFAASPQLCTWMSHLLYTGWQLLNAELERLCFMVEVPGMESLPQATQLQTAFVEALGQFGDIAHEDYHTCRTLLLEALCVPPSAECPTTALVGPGLSGDHDGPEHGPAANTPTDATPPNGE